MTLYKSVNGEIVQLTEAEEEAVRAEWNAPPPPPTEEDVKIERDRRLNGDFLFQGKLFQRDNKSLQRITGAGSLAQGYLLARGDPKSLKWHATLEDPEPEDFVWIASDDTLVPMDAQTVFSFAREAAAVETRLIFAAKRLRMMDPIPDDFTDDKWWP